MEWIVLGCVVVSAAACVGLLLLALCKAAAEPTVGHRPRPEWPEWEWPRREEWWPPERR